MASSRSSKSISKDRPDFTSNWEFRPGASAIKICYYTFKELQNLLIKKLYTYFWVQKQTV